MGRQFIGCLPLSVIKEIFEKDIRKRVKIRNVEVFEAVRGFIINNFGATMSIQSLQRSLEKIGLSVQRATLKRYIDALVDAKILYQCNRFDMKSKKAMSGEKKYYLADTSFYFALNTETTLEQIVDAVYEKYDAPKETIYFEKR